MSNIVSDFVHLHVHTQYSLLDGAIRLKSLIDSTKQNNMKAAAITDHGTMYGVVEYYDMARKADVKPILGFEAYVAPRRLTDKSSPADGTGLCHLVLLAENNAGYKNLCKLASIAQLKGFYYKPRIDHEVLKEHSEGVIALSACLAGEIPRQIIAGKIDKAEEITRFYQTLFGEDNFFLEVQHNNITEQYKVNDALFEMSKKLSVPLVATNDCHYLNASDVRAHEILLCIQTGATINSEKRFRFGTDQLYFKSTEEMIASFPDHPEAITNTVAIADRCNVDIDFNTYHFPLFEPNSELSEAELFDTEARKGFEKRIEKIREKTPDINYEDYKKRLDYEIKTINDMGFPGYFLIVADFIRYAKENGVPVGPGRGSAAGSIVAYSMGITDLDPIEHGLIFERFLNPARMSMPDIDVDFCINGREKVYKYVSEKYGGGDYVSQIITFGTLKTKAVIRDVGRALEIPLSEVDTIAKLVPDTLGISIADALNEEPALKELTESREDYKELISVSRVLEGLTRHASTHAAGVVVSDQPLVEYLPLHKGKNDEVVTQFDMKRVEQIGLVKFDFLGLRNLTVIEDTLRLIEQQGKPRPDLLAQDFNDPETFRLLCSGDTTGVFQLESAGMKELLVRLKPERFNDITALVALYRPGPLDSGMVASYVERKHGREPVEYLLPELEPILEETYGVILYQEQVMKIAGSLANYSMADADGLRKAMGKKIASIMAEHRELFMKGAKENNLDTNKAGQIFDLMEKFGGYGFNKSHSAAYALVCFQTAFLKAHYIVEFMAALLTSEMNSADGVVKFIDECRKHDIEVLPPDVNESGKTFVVNEDKIIFGLVAVKNVGEGPIGAILEEREKNGRFHSFFEFCERVDLRRINKRVIESLIKCGAFDSTGNKRSQMVAALEDAIEHGQRIQKEKNDKQMSLFGDDHGNEIRLNAPCLPDIEEWEDKYRLVQEKEILGFYISGHPLDKYSDIIEKYTDLNSVSVQELSSDRPGRIGGVITAVKVIRTKKGDQMAFVNLEDKFGTVESVVFPRIYSKESPKLIEDNGVIIQGTIQVKENGVSIIADEIVPIEMAEETWSASVHVHIDPILSSPDISKHVMDIVERYPGNCKVYAHLTIPEKSETIIELPDHFRVNANKSFSSDIKAIIGHKNFETTCKSIKLVNENKRKKFYKKN